MHFIHVPFILYLVLEESKEGKTMKKMTSRHKQAIQTKNKLIDVSAELIRKYGYDSVTIQQICKTAGVSTGAFYHHLKSKAGIIIEGYAECDNYFDDIVNKEITGESYIEKILNYIGYQMKYAEDMGIDLMIQLYKAQITEGNDFFLSDDRGLPTGLFKLVKAAQDNHELSKHCSYQQLGKEILIISRGIIYNWCQCEGNYSLVPYAEKIINNYLYAFKAENQS